MNVLILGWINDHTLGTPTDDSGNTYQLAVYQKNNGMNQAVYYACDIAARTNNIVHVLFDSDLQVDMQILEYSGIAATPCLDQFNTNAGSSLSIDSGTVTTMQGHELVLGAGTILNNAAGVDPAFAYKVTYDFSIAETLEVFATGTYRAKATQSSIGDWVMQIVTFNGM